MRYPKLDTLYYISMLIKLEKIVFKYLYRSLGTDIDLIDCPELCSSLIQTVCSNVFQFYR